mgnify:CR=1 FL=1
MLNGDGVRVVLWVAGCSHHCPKCQNPETWDYNGGIPFDDSAMQEIFNELEHDWCTGLTLSGGDPLHVKNRETVFKLCSIVKERFPNKTIWCYTGYEWETIKNIPEIRNIDVLIDGKFDIMKADINYPWAGSTNQRVIDVPKSLSERSVILYAST